MITPKTACELAQSLPGVSVKNHFGSDAFTANKRMFATVWHEERSVNLRLTLELQQKFLEEDGEAFVEIDNAWGRQGWTRVQLDFVERAIFSKALKAAHECSATPGRPLGKKRPAAKKKKTARVR